LHFSIKSNENFSARSLSGTKNQKVVYEGSTSAIQEIGKLNTTHFIYPNPANKAVNINYEGLKRFEIVALNGRTIKTLSTSDKTISIDDIKTGEYIIRIYSENKLLVTEKFFKVED
jgi:hypothetical protein